MEQLFRGRSLCKLTSGANGLVGILLSILISTASARPPVVTEVSIGDGSDQRSIVTSLSATFDQDVSASLGSGDLQLTPQPSSIVLQPLAVVWDEPSMTATWTFPNEVGGTLPNGNYTASLLASSVSNGGGELLDGDGDGAEGGDFSFEFFRYFGDFDGDRDVDFLDTCRFREALNTSLGDTAYFAAFDADGDGMIDASDLALFQQNYLTYFPVVPLAPTLDVFGGQTSDTQLILTGTSTPNTTIRIVNGTNSIEVTTDGSGRFSATIPLNPNGVNAISVTAVGVGDSVSQVVPVTITQDSEAPVLTVEFPANGSSTNLETSNLYGSVSDMLSGFEGLTVEVAVNGGAPVTATIDREIGTNGRYEASDLPLNIGENTIVVTARDNLGNQIVRTVTLTRLAQESQIALISGSNQTARRNQSVASPLVVQVLDANNLPLADKVVTFEVIRSDGLIAGDNDQNSDPRIVQVLSDGDGFASASLTVGSNSGNLNNWVQASSVDVPGEVIFRATSEPNPASQINITMGDGQRGETEGFALEDLAVWVSDGLNGVSGVPVTFQIKRGGGKVNGSDMVTVNTNATGHAEVRFTFGPNGGNNLVDVNFATNTSDPVTFNLVGLQRFVDQPTTFVGIVLDNSNLPIGGATVTVESGSFVSPPSVSGDDGIFSVEGILPGAAKLRVRGRNATTLNGEAITQTNPRYPNLVYQVNVVSNARNSLPTPVLLPTLNPANEKVYDGTQDVTLTVEGVEGVEFVVKAGSVTLEDGTVPDAANPATLSLNQVHIDNLPMPLPDGTASLFAWTMQPSEMHLDPPAAVQLPNMNTLTPGARTNILSFDHATERFEIVANAVISQDGSVIRSLDGEGISVSGWGGACPPYNTGGPVNGDGGGMDPDREDEEDPTDDCPDAQAGSDNNSCPACPGTANPVIIGTGEKTLTEVDLRIPGRGMDFVWQRSYRSRYDYDGPIGHNWEHNHNQRITITDTGDARSSNGEARVDYYMSNGDDTFTSPPGFFNVLRRNADGTLTLRDPSGMRTQFDSLGRLIARIDRNGNSIGYRYNADDRLDRITDTLGRHIEISYNALGRIESVEDFFGREITYTYNGLGELVQVRSPLVEGTSNANDFSEGKITRYSYLSGYDGELEPLNHNLESVTDPKGQKYLVNRYGTDPTAFDFDKVILQQIGEQDQQMSFVYEELNPGVAPGPDILKVRTTTTDRNGNVVEYNCNSVGHILEERRFTNRGVNPSDPEVFVTLRDYDGDALLESVTYPEGNQEFYTYDRTNPDRFQQRNILSITKTPGPRGGDQTALTTSFTYEPIYNLVASTTEARGNDTSFIPQNGGAQSRARYTTTKVFDYQEGNNLASLADETGLTQAEVSAKLSAAGVALNLGDLNADGLTDQIAGNVIRNVSPPVALIDGSSQEVLTDHRYNRFGQKTAVIDPEGNVDLYEYHPENDPDGDGTLTAGASLASDTGGYLAAMVRDAETSTRRGALPLEQIRTERFYDEVGNVIRSVDGRGNDTLFEVNALNQIIRRSSELPFRYETVFFYDANDNVVKQEVQNIATNGPDLDGFVTTDYDYDILNDRTEMRQEVSTSEILITSYDYDGNQNLVSVTQPEGNIVSTIYDERDLVYSVTRGFGSDVASTSTTTYDGSRNPVAITDAEDNNGDSLPETTRLIYDGFDRRTEVLDTEGNRITYSYDPASNLVSEQKFGLNGGPSRLSNSTTGNVLLSRRDCRFDELSRRYQCDDQLFANLVTVGPEGSLSPGDGFVTTQWEFDRSSRLVLSRDDNNNRSTTGYDGLDRRVAEADAVGNLVVYTYDDNSNLRTVTETDVSPEGTVPDEVFLTTFDYDSLDRRTSVLDNLSNETGYDYDSRDNRILTTDALGNTTTEIYDGLNRKIATVRDLRVGGVGSGAIDTSNPNNPDGQIERLADWDGNSRLVSETDDNGNSTFYGYDALNRRDTESFADGLSKIYTYDRDNNLVTYTDQNGSVCTHTYDGLNRLRQKDVTRAAGVLGFTQQTFEYDGLSRRTRANDNNDPNLAVDDSEVTFAYDSLSRLLAEVQNGKTVAGTYDGVGRRLSCTYPDGRVVEQSHDAVDRVKTISDQGAVTSIAEYDYLGVSRILERRHGNGTRLTHHDDAGNQTGYDALRREIQHRHIDSTGALVTGFTYAYDRVHNRRFENDLRTGTADAYQYDSTYRLTRTGYETPSSTIAAISNNATTNADTAGLGSGTEQWELDGVSNWETRDEDGTATSYAPNVMNEYDSVDGVAFIHDDNGNLQSDGDLAFFHDHLNRLVRLERSGTLVATYAYDAVGRRIAKFLPSSQVHFFHAAAHCIEERDQADTTARQYVYGIRIDEPIELRTNGQSYYYHCNSLGSIFALTNQSGTTTERYDYNAYGETTIQDTSGTEITESAVGNPYTFTARRLEEESNLHYYRARYYSASLGRFIERDPLGYVDGMGLYSYTQSNPVNFVDAFGMERQSPLEGMRGDQIIQPELTLIEKAQKAALGKILGKLLGKASQLLKVRSSMHMFALPGLKYCPEDVDEALRELRQEYDDLQGNIDEAFEDRQTDWSGFDELYRRYSGNGLVFDKDSFDRQQLERQRRADTQLYQTKTNELRRSYEGSKKQLESFKAWIESSKEAKERCECPNN